jgi:hypothetical protein
MGIQLRQKSQYQRKRSSLFDRAKTEDKVTTQTMDVMV